MRSHPFPKCIVWYSELAKAQFANDPSLDEWNHCYSFLLVMFKCVLLTRKEWDEYSVWFDRGWKGGGV